MYKGNNPTALQSQKMITDALLFLMESKDFSKINVKEICDKALVSRQTFYSLFQTKEEVIELYFDKLFTDYAKQFEKSQVITVRYICSTSVSYLFENRFFIGLLVNNNLNYIMTRKMEEYLIELGSIINASKRKEDPYAMAFISGALVEIISRYIKNNSFENPEEISILIEKILTGKYFGINL